METTMRTYVFCCIAACIMLAQSAMLAQIDPKYYKTAEGGEAEITLLNVNTANLLDRGNSFVNSSLIKGAVSVSDYSGNLTLGHSMEIPYPNDLKTKLTLTFNANASHAYFENLLGKNKVEGWGLDYQFTGKTVRENSVNAACWVFGINGIALQTTNFEENFFLGNIDDPTQPIQEGEYFSGTQVPLLATGYQYTNDVSFPWNYPEWTKLRVISPGDPIPPDVMFTDKIRIMNSEGSVVTLVNPTSEFNNPWNDTSRRDYHLTGVYFDSDEKSNGYAIVKWINELYELRRIWYKPGDGLTYYFEEEYPKYQNLDSWSAWGDAETNRPKIAYLRSIQSQNGDRITFSYDYQSVFGTNVTRGRKFLKSIQYYKNGGPVSGTAITFNYVKNANNMYQINIQNALSGESYTIGLNNYSPANDAGFGNITRDTTVSTTNIMEVNNITNNNGPTKTVSFSYDNHVRRYQFAAFSNAANWYLYHTCQDHVNIDVIYSLRYSTKTLMSREIYHGEKENFVYWTSTQLDGTPLYDPMSSYNVPDAEWDASCIPKPYEQTNREGYYINVYLNNPESSYRYYRYFTDDNLHWQKYLVGYHYGNMNYSMRDNYTALMMKTVTSRVYNDQTANFDPVSQQDYSYSWGRTLYRDVGSIPHFTACSDQQYDDMSPRITNIITAITTTNLTGEQNSAQHSYVMKKNFEWLRKSTKFRKFSQDYLIAPNLDTDIRLDTESVFDGNNTLLQSIAYNYNDNAEQRTVNATRMSFLSFYYLHSPTDMSLVSKVVSYNGVPKATVYSSQTINTFGYILDSLWSHTGFRPDTCIVKNLAEDISTTSETYRQSSQAQSVRKYGIFTSCFGVTASTNYTDTNYIYRPALPTEQLVYFQKGTSGNFRRNSRTVNIYSQTNRVNYGKLIQQTAYAATDVAPVTTTYIYDSTGSYAGYLRKILYDNGSDVRFLYNTEVTPSGKLYCSNGTTISNPFVSWGGAFQTPPFETIKEYDGKSLTMFTAYDGKSNVYFSVDENGYYSANYYDGLGRIVKQLKPGNFDPNNPYLPVDAGSAPQGSMIATYSDNLWTPQVTTTAYRDNAGTAVQTLSQFRPDSLAFETYAIDGGSQILKSREKVNYLGKKWYSRDGDGVRAFYYYDAFLNLRQTRFADSTSSAPTTQQVVDYDGGDSYFKRVKSTDENGNYGYSYYDLFGNILKSERYLGTKVLTTTFSYGNNGRLEVVSTPEGKLSTYVYDVRGNDSLRFTPDAGTTQCLYDKYGNLRLVKDANHTGTGTNPGTIINQPGSANASGSFTLNMPGKVNLSISVGAGPSSGTISITKNGVTLCSTTNNASGTVTNSIVLPKGTFGWSYTMSNPGQGYYIYSVSCGNANEFVYNKYDGLNRLVETGEYVMNSMADFTQANADNTSFPSSNTLVTKKYIYDVVSTDAEASGQRNVSGRVSQTDAYRFGQLCNRSIYSYDELGRVEWEVQKELGIYAKKLYYQYDLQGNVTQKKYMDLSGNCNMYTMYDYDQQGRLLRVWTATDSLGTQKVKDGEYTYLPSNRLQRLKLGATPAQTLDYTYNDRGWLTKINDPDVMGTDLFALNLGYDTSEKIATVFPFTPQYNGNVSWLVYRIAGALYSSPYGNTDYLGRVFTYDSTNRLTSAPFGYRYASPWRTAGDRYAEFYKYSDDGNFTKLGRHDGGGALIDSLSYTYVGGRNQLASYTNTAGSGSTYTYDENGNVVSDSRSNIAFMIYDINNLPVAVYTTTGVSQIYAYDVNGSRVRKWSSNGTDTYYLNDPTGKTELVQKGVGNSVYTCNIYGTDNLGMALRNGAGVNRLYYLKDHLGSVRATVRVDSTVLADDFSGTLSQWTTVLGSGFSIVNGQLSDSAGGPDNVAINASPALFADGILGADVTNLSAGAADANIVFRYQNPSNYYMVQAYNTQVMIFKKVAGTYYNVSNYVASSQFLGGPHKLQASVSGRTITVYWKGQQVLNWTDTDPNNVWMSGKVGVRQCLYRKIRWDNFYAITTCPAQVVAYDDYYPYGLVMPGRSSNAGLADTRYKFTGKERDAAETGYDYFGARYYDARIGRWLAVDPLAGKYPGMSPFNYVSNNPLRNIDPSGTAWIKIGSDSHPEYIWRDDPEVDQRKVEQANKDLVNGGASGQSGLQKMGSAVTIEGSFGPRFSGGVGVKDSQGNLIAGGEAGFGDAIVIGSNLAGKGFIKTEGGGEAGLKSGILDFVLGGKGGTIIDGNGPPRNYFDPAGTASGTIGNGVGDLSKGTEGTTVSLGFQGVLVGGKVSVNPTQFTQGASEWGAGLMQSVRGILSTCQLAATNLRFIPGLWP
jgi:RHS repeat-associated protein